MRGADDIVGCGMGGGRETHPGRTGAPPIPQPKVPGCGRRYKIRMAVPAASVWG